MCIRDRILMNLPPRVGRARRGVRVAIRLERPCSSKDSNGVLVWPQLDVWLAEQRNGMLSQCSRVKYQFEIHWWHWSVLEASSFISRLDQEQYIPHSHEYGRLRASLRAAIDDRIKEGKMVLYGLFLTAFLCCVVMGVFRFQKGFVELVWWA